MTKQSIAELLAWGLEHGIGLVEGTGPSGVPTVDEAAKAADRSSRWLRGQMAKGVVGYKMIGRTPYPNKTCLIELFAANEHPPRQTLPTPRPGRYGRPVGDIATSEPTNGGASPPKPRRMMTEARAAAAELRERRRRAREVGTGEDPT